MSVLVANIFAGTAIVASVVAIYCQREKFVDYYENYEANKAKKHEKSMAAKKNKQIITPNGIDESFFIMSTMQRCHNPHDYSDKDLDKCSHKYCRAKTVREIIRNIDSARHLVCLCMYQISIDLFSEALIKAKKRGVKIRIITDKVMIESSNSKIIKLERAGIVIRVGGDSVKLMHNKFCLIDVLNNEAECLKNSHPTNGVLINGSFNWTTNGVSRNYENIMITSSENQKDSFKEAFDYIWESLRVNPKTNGVPKYTGLD